MPGNRILGLAVETSSARGSLALIENTENGPILLSEESWHKGGSHSERITLAMTAALSRAQVSLKDLSVLGVGVGPGSFTGIRVGVNFVRALAYALRLPVSSANSLRVMAQSALKQHARVLCVANAFKGKIYAAGFERADSNLNIWLEPQALDAAEIPPLFGRSSVVLADDHSTFHNIAPDLFESPGANDRFLVQPPSAFDLWQVITEDELKPAHWKSVVPLYIRASDAEEKLRDGTLKLPPRL